MTLSGTDILAVADQSGTSHNLSWTGSAKPQYNATGFNSKQAFVFSSTGTAFTNTSFPLGTGNTLTCWYVGNLNGGTSNSNCGLISYVGAGQSQDWQSVNSFVLYRPLLSLTLLGFTRSVDTQRPWTANANHRVIVTIDSSGVMTFYIDGVAQTTASAPGNWTSPGELNIGRSKSAAYWGGPVGEIGIATGFTNSTDVATLDTYLKTKWGL